MKKTLDQHVMQKQQLQHKRHSSNNSSCNLELQMQTAPALPPPPLVVAGGQPSGKPPAKRG